MNGDTENRFERKTSLLTIIFILYLLLTLTNIMIFWIAIGANQFRLIKEKAVAETNSQTLEIIRRLTPVMQGVEWLPILKEAKAAKFSVFAEKLRVLRESDKLIVGNFQLVSAAGKIFYSFPPESAGIKHDEVFFKKLAVSLHLRELNNQPFYAEPESASYFVEVFIPLLVSGSENLIFYSRLPMESLAKELRGLIILIVAMLLLIFLAEALFGYALYRIVILPIKRLSKSTEAVALGDYDLTLEVGEKKDELAQLGFMFNRMSSMLKEKEQRLNATISDLEKYHSMMQAELQMAQTIQEGIMPRSFSCPFFSAAIYYNQLEKISGDYYDFFHLADGSVGVLIADVSGHGVPAALITMMAKVYFSNLSVNAETPAALFELVNGEIGRGIQTRDYITAFYMIIHPDLSCSFTAAGHDAQGLLRRETQTCERLAVAGFFLGMFEKAPLPFETQTVMLRPGDRVVLYTDGITESVDTDGKDYSRERLLETARANLHLKIADQVDAIMKDFFSFMGGENQKDDLTLIILEVSG